jgi:hypothetical protein
MPKRSPEEIKEAIYHYLFKKDLFTLERYEDSLDKFSMLCSYFWGINGYYADQFEGNGTIKIQKWAVKALAEGLSKYSEEKRNLNLDITLEDAFGIPHENKIEKITSLYADNKKIIFNWINKIRMHYGLNIKDSVSATFKVIEWYKENQPNAIYNFNASQKSIQDAYYRTYPQHEFIKWVAVMASKPGKLQYHIDWLEKSVPEAVTLIRRKVKNKQL